MIRMLGDECRELVDHAERTYRFRSTRDLHCQRIRLKAFRHSPLLREVSLDDYGLFDMLDRCRDRLDFVFFSSDRMTEKAFLMTAVIGAASTILPVSRILQGEPSADFTALRIITVIMLILLAAFMIRRKP